MKTQQAVDRLNARLPLKARQEQLPAGLKSIYQAILYSLANEGRPPAPAELARLVGEGDVQSALQILGKEDLVVLNAEGNAAVGAYPMTIEMTPHQIQINGQGLYAMCALDAVSIAPMFKTEVSIDSRCHVTQTPVHIRMRDSNILEAVPSDTRVGVRWQQPCGVAAHSMCLEMIFLKHLSTAAAWQNGDTENISIFTLPEAIAFGRMFFLPLLQ